MKDRELSILRDYVACHAGAPPEGTGKVLLQYEESNFNQGRYFKVVGPVPLSKHVAFIVHTLLSD